MMMNDIAWMQSNPGKLALTVLVLIAIGMVALAVEWLRLLMNGWLAMIVVSLILLVMALLIHPVRGHDGHNPGLNDWLKSLTSKSKTLCCDGNDTDAIEDWETSGNRYRVKFRGQWFDVPEDTVVDGPNKGGGALLWMNKGYSGMSVRCFIPGSMT